jgi:salicylate hydroxylase
VAHFDSDSCTEESWTRECDVSELTTTYAGWHPDLLRLYTYSARWYKWSLYDRDPVERWSKGRVALLGDSAHAMLPCLGQGAAMAIEDACVLSAALGLALLRRRPGRDRDGEGRGGGSRASAPCRPLAEFARRTTAGARPEEPAQIMRAAPSRATRRNYPNCFS